MDRGPRGGPDRWRRRDRPAGAIPAGVAGTALRCRCRPYAGPLCRRESSVWLTGAPDRRSLRAGFWVEETIAMSGYGYASYGAGYGYYELSLGGYNTARGALTGPGSSAYSQDGGITSYAHEGYNGGIFTQTTFEHGNIYQGCDELQLRRRIFLLRRGRGLRRHRRLLQPEFIFELFLRARQLSGRPPGLLVLVERPRRLWRLRPTDNHRLLAAELRRWVLLRELSQHVGPVQLRRRSGAGDLDELFLDQQLRRCDRLSVDLPHALSDEYP